MDAIYARQSIDKKDSISIETQIEYCKRFSSEEPLVFHDKGFSGKNTNRPAFQQLMEAVETGQVSKIIVYRLDRFSRSIADFSQIWTKLEQRNVEFQSVTENFDTSSPMGRAMLNIVLVFAQLERETTAERVRDNYQHRFALGSWPGGPAPFGFDLTKISDTNGRQVSSLVANSNAPVVHKIFQLYAQDSASLRSVAIALNAEGIPGPRRKTWDNVTLSRILHSPLYVQATEDVFWWYLSKGLQPKQEATAFDGTHACNVIGKRDRSKGKYQDLDQQSFSLSNHQGSTPAGLWLKCQEKLDRNRQFAPSTSGKHSWLTGLLKCGSCGYAIKVVRDSSTQKRYLICSGRTNMASCSAHINVNLNELEVAIADKLKEILDQCPEEEIYPEENNFSQEIQQINARIERLVNALAESSTISISYINTQIEKLHHQRERLLKEIQSSPHKGSQKLRINFDRASFEEKKIIAREFIDKILLKDDTVDIIWKF